MKSSEVIEVLTACRPQMGGVTSDIGLRDDVAYIRLESARVPGRWAVVSSPGDRWFSLDVDGGFSLNHFEEETSDQEATQMIRDYLDKALIYLRDGATPVRGDGWLRVPSLALKTPTGEVTLRRSLVGHVRTLLRPWRRA